MIPLGMRSHSRRQTVLLAILSAIAMAIFAVSVVRFLQTREYYLTSDSFYYYSLAEGLHKTGHMVDLAFIPAKPAWTPQIGIVLVMAGLMSLGINRETLFISIVAINLLAYLSCLFPLARLGSMVGFRSRFQHAAILIAVLVAFNEYLGYCLAVLNDGLFNALSVWLVYCISRMFAYCQSGDRGSSDAKAHLRALLAAAALLSCIAVWFRVQALLIPFSALVVAVAVYVRAKQALPAVYFLILSCCTVLAFLSVYLFLGITGLKGAGSQVFISPLSHLSQKVMFFAQTYLVFWVALGTIVFGVHRLWRRGSALSSRGIGGNPATGASGKVAEGPSGPSIGSRATVVAFVATVCVTAMAFTLGMEYWLPFARYCAYIWPFTVLVVLLPAATRYVGYATLMLMAGCTVYNVRRAAEYYHQQRFFLYVDKNRISIPANNAIVFSENEVVRLSYYFLNMRVGGNAEKRLETLGPSDTVFVVGSSAYSNRQIGAIRQVVSRRGMDFKATSLTADYHDEAGNSLVRLSDFRPSYPTLFPPTRP